VKHARYYWLLLAEGHLTRQRFGGMLRRVAACRCAAGVQSRRAILHSFGYKKAVGAFVEVAEKDPACGMAFGGLAMTYYHPIWEAPNPTVLKQGWAAVERAKSASAKTQRERDYIAAIEVFYKDSDKLDHRTRALAYEKAMEPTGMVIHFKAILPVASLCHIFTWHS